MNTPRKPTDDRVCPRCDGACAPDPSPRAEETAQRAVAAYDDAPPECTCDAPDGPHALVCVRVLG